MRDCFLNIVELLDFLKLSIAYLNAASGSLTSGKSKLLNNVTCDEQMRLLSFDLITIMVFLGKQSLPTYTSKLFES